VPVSQLASALAFARAELDRLGLLGSIAGHAGDGNVHVGIWIDPSNAEEVEASDEFVRLTVEDALARGGTCTGEHGIGIGKVDALEREHADLVPLMRSIKAVFDPQGIMNPGKVIRPTR
jgi:D-lactate dehydrogenase (cytochrome)